MSKSRFHEQLYPSWDQTFVVDEVLFEQETDRQHLIIFRNRAFGKVMALDGIVQTTEHDEFIYHEMLAHVPLFSHPAPKRVLIIGGGDGGILREVVKHPGVTRAVQVEIDQAVIDLCREHFPAHSAGAFEDPRVEVIIADGIDYVNTTDSMFDVIIADSTDPVGPGEVLFTGRFYRGVERCLADGGIFAAQNGVAFVQRDEVTGTWRRLNRLFADVSFFTVAVPTYVGGVMTLAWACQNPSVRAALSETAVAERVAAAGVSTRYYNPAMHVAAFALPTYIAQACRDDSHD